MLRQLGRKALSAWGHSYVAPGYHYMMVERFGPSLAEREPIDAVLPNGCRIRCDLRDHIQRHQWFFGAYEPVDSFLLARLMRPGMTFIDAGANIGQYTLLAATAVGATGTVHAFEPIPKNFERLQQAVAANGLTNVRANRAALWNETAQLRFDLPGDAKDNAGTYGVVLGADRGAAIEAPALRLDDYLASAGVSRVDMIKMDVEGAEPFALEGARATLERDRPMILMEVNRASFLGESGESCARMGDLLRAIGYRIWRVGHDASASGPAANLDTIERSNVILHHDDLPPEVTGGWDLRTALRWARRER
jgi:FkbM family methyltransferase